MPYARQTGKSRSLRIASKSDFSQSREAPEIDLPGPDQWRKLSYDEKNTLLTGLATELGHEVRRADSWITLLTPVHTKAVEHRRLDVAEWTQERQQHAQLRCPRAQLVFQGDHAVFVDCKTRGCPHCHERLATSAAAKWAAKLLALDQPIYGVVCGNSREAASVVDYATKLDHATLRITMPDSVIIFTTHERKGARRENLDGLQDLIFDFLIALKPGEARVTGNKILNDVEITEESTEDPPDQRRKSADGEGDPPILITKAGWRYLVLKGWITHAGGRRWKIDIPATGLKKFWRINSGQPPQHAYRPAA